MKKEVQKVLILLLPLLGWACVEQVEFDNGAPADLLVVNGSVQAGAAVHRVRLTRSNDLEKRVFRPQEGAIVRLHMVEGPAGIYEEVEPGLYELNGQEVPALVGEEYFLEITLVNGGRYQSDPERIPPGVEIDSLSFSKVFGEVVNDLGNVINRKYVALNVHSKIPDFPEGPYIRWQVDEVYKVTERLCGPMPKACYLYPPDFIPPVRLLNGDLYAPGLPIAETLVRRNINYAFGERYSFSVYQASHTKRAFEYWTKINQIVALEGSIFDRPPAPIVGNVYSTTNPEEEVLGYISAVSVDTVHLFLSRFDVLDFEPVQPLCGIPGFPLNGGFNLACCNCLELDHSTYERPDFW